MSAKADIRRNDPSRWTAPFKFRKESALPFSSAVLSRGATVLFDSMVYTDLEQGKIPAPLKEALRHATVFHSSVARAEIALNIAILDPHHAGTAAVREELEEILSHMRDERIFAPSSRAWVEAGLMVGILARTQKYQPSERRRLLNDALLFMTAREHGLTLVSRNVGDMDLLGQLRPDTKLLLYR